MVLVIRQLQISCTDKDRWFGGLTSTARRSPDKARIFSIITVCMAVLQREKDGALADLKVTSDKLSMMFTSSTSLANDLLSSDDRFLVTVSAFLTLKTELRVCCPYRVILAAFREIHFDAKIIIAWIDNDEFGFDAVLKIIDYLIEYRSKLDTVADSKSLSSPSAKRPRPLPNDDDDHRVTYLYERPTPSDSDVIVTVRIPYLEQCEGRCEETFSFSKQPAIHYRYQVNAPNESDDDFDSMVEMFVEVKLLLNRKLLEEEHHVKDITKLQDALAKFLDNDSDTENCREHSEKSSDDNDDEEEEDVEENEGQTKSVSSEE
ncbi:hypothetical protein DICVIV_04968 [Dictyocaulus viviparus]|uniref:Uncharacterized protein n=1 Tax=Dictyocaulus viviparus TaxID=29172 RepID=A0A0D8XW81_DICVI|nr:hypothetical protein DICVIV_04968 [Dictyocaulus viviparus]